MSDRPIFSAKSKDGYTVAIRLIVTDTEGQIISDAVGEWFGFDRTGANEAALELSDSVAGVSKKYAEGYKKAGRK